MASDEVEITEYPGAGRYEARLGGELAGLVTFRAEPGRVVFEHTETEPAFEGRGVASALAERVLDDARARKETVVPLCPYIAGYIRRHPAYGDLVAH